GARGVRAVALPGARPAGGGARLRDLLPEEPERDTAHALTAAAVGGLIACGLAGAEELRPFRAYDWSRPPAAPHETTWPAREAARALFAAADRPDRLGRSPAGAPITLIVGPALEDPPATHEMVGPALAALTGWLSRCAEALAAVPVPPPWGPPA